MRQAISTLAILVTATIPAMAEPEPMFEIFLDGSTKTEARQAIQLQINNVPAGDQERAAVDFVADCSKQYGPTSIQSINAQLFLAQSYWRSGRLKEAKATLLNLIQYCEQHDLKGTKIRMCDSWTGPYFQSLIVLAEIYRQQGDSQNYAKQIKFAKAVYIKSLYPRSVEKSEGLSLTDGFYSSYFDTMTSELHPVYDKLRLTGEEARIQRRDGVTAQRFLIQAKNEAAKYSAESGGYVADISWRLGQLYTDHAQYQLAQQQFQTAINLYRMELATFHNCDSLLKDIRLCLDKYEHCLKQAGKNQEAEKIKQQRAAITTWHK